MGPPPPWWADAVVYQVYPRSFQDSDGDGIGDLGGILQRLDHLSDLGVDVLWLSPVYPSPQADNGYDISDYQDVDPMFGTLEQLDALIAGLHDRGTIELGAVADLVVDTFVEVATAVDEDVDELEASVFSPERTDDIGRLYQLKRELMSLRRAVAPLEVPLTKLAERDVEGIPEAMRSYFRDVLDHSIRVRDQVGALDELLTSILQASLAITSLADNEDNRKISAWAAMIAVPTLFTGLYGMNFDVMPELHWRFGYPTVVVVILTVCFTLYRGFKRSGWL